MALQLEVEKQRKNKPRYTHQSRSPKATMPARREDGLFTHHPIKAVSNSLARTMKLDVLLRPLLLIYQMPKVGSQTIEATLKQCSLPHQVFRIHFLSPAIADTMRAGLRSLEATDAWKHDALWQLRLMESLRRVIRIRRFLQSCGWPLSKIQVISAVREPISLSLSSLFENYFPVFPSSEEEVLLRCRRDLLKPKTLQFVQAWFDLELGPMLGVDVYDKPFPRQQGYALYETRFVRALVYRFEGIEQLPLILEEFLNCKIDKVEPRNLASAKPYASQYRYVKQHLRLPAGFVAEQCASRMMRHFYSEEERHAFQAQWSEPEVAVGEADRIPA
jgi:hypothetical protein